MSTFARQFFINQIYIAFIWEYLRIVSHCVERKKQKMLWILIVGCIFSR